MIDCLFDNVYSGACKQEVGLWLMVIGISIILIILAYYNYKSKEGGVKK